MIRQKQAENRVQGSKCCTQNKTIAFSVTVCAGSSKSHNILYFTDLTPTEASRRKWAAFSPKKKQFPGGIWDLPICNTPISPASLNQESRDTKQLKHIPLKSQR